MRTWIGFIVAFAGCNDRSLSTSASDGAPATDMLLKCGGEIGYGCPPGMFCDYPDGQCASDEFGVCALPPSNCDDASQPECGCNQQTYPNACQRRAAGVSLLHKGQCDVGFICGSKTCAANEICVHVCDCCGMPPVDGGEQPSGHDECVTDTGECPGGTFQLEGKWCFCESAREAQCLCA